MLAKLHMQSTEKLKYEETHGHPYRSTEIQVSHREPHEHKSLSFHFWRKQQRDSLLTVSSGATTSPPGPLLQGTELGGPQGHREPGSDGGDREESPAGSPVGRAEGRGGVSQHGEKLEGLRKL